MTTSASRACLPGKSMSVMRSAVEVDNLEPEAGQVLHATFCGAKLPERRCREPVIYNIDTFRVAGRNGIRFEYGDPMPPAPQGDEHRFYYRYALASRSDTLTHWNKGRVLASFDWTDLGAFKAEKQLAQVWVGAVARRGPGLLPGDCAEHTVRRPN